jgi:hypothetical protein
MLLCACTPGGRGGKQLIAVLNNCRLNNLNHWLWYSWETQSRLLRSQTPPILPQFHKVISRGKFGRILTLTRTVCSPVLYPPRLVMNPEAALVFLERNPRHLSYCKAVCRTVYGMERSRLGGSNDVCTTQNERRLQIIVQYNLPQSRDCIVTITIIDWVATPKYNTNCWKITQKQFSTIWLFRPLLVQERACSSTRRLRLIQLVWTFGLYQLLSIIGHSRRPRRKLYQNFGQICSNEDDYVPDRLTDTTLKKTTS